MKATGVREAAVLFLTLLWAGPLRADGEPAVAAAPAVEAGRKALEQKDWPAARTEFTRALELDPRSDEARLGMAETLAGLADSAGSRKLLRELLVDLETQVPLDAPRVAIYARARKRLIDASKSDAALDALVRKHAEGLAATATKWASKDPEAAEEAYMSALRLAPDLPGIPERLAKLKEGASGRVIRCFNGRDSTGWDFFAAPMWRVVGGAIVAEIKSPYIMRYHRKWSGDYDVVVELQLLEEYPKEGVPHISIRAHYVDDHNNLGFGYMAGRLEVHSGYGKAEDDHTVHFAKLFTELEGSPDPRAWNVYEIRFRGKQVTAMLNGKEIASASRPLAPAPGYVAVKGQCAKFTIRRAEVILR